MCSFSLGWVMGNTSGREGQVVPGAEGAEGAAGAGGGAGHGNQGGNANRLPQYPVPPYGHHHHHPTTIRDPIRMAHAASADSMGNSPSDSPGSAARSPLMFTPQVMPSLPHYLLHFGTYATMLHSDKILL